MNDLRTQELSDLSRASFTELLSRASKSGMTGLTIWKTADGHWQANLQLNRDGWQVVTADQPDKAIFEVLSLDTTIEQILLGQAVARLLRALKKREQTR